MTDSNLLNRARGVLNLYRGASGGERQAARGALVRLLSTHGLTFRDLEPGLPPTRDPDDLEGWRPAQGWLAALGTDGQDDALLRLVDAEDLSVPERRQVLEALSVPALVASRAAGWLDADPELTEELLVQAGAALTPEDIVQDARPIAQAVQLRALQSAWVLARPERQIRADSEVHAEFLAGLLDGLGARRARIEVQGTQGAGEGAPRFVVLARLSAGELSRFRTAAAQHGPRLDSELRRAARQLGRELGGSGS